MICQNCGHEQEHPDWVWAGASLWRVQNAVRAYEKLVEAQRSPWSQLKAAFKGWLKSFRKPKKYTGRKSVSVWRG